MANIFKEGGHVRRRDVLIWMAMLGPAAALAACTPGQGETGSGNEADKYPVELGSAMWLAKEFAKQHKDPQLFAQLQYLEGVKDIATRDLLAEFFINNSRAVQTNGIQAVENFYTAQQRVLGVSKCPDSRCGSLFLTEVMEVSATVDDAALAEQWRVQYSSALGAGPQIFSGKDMTAIVTHGVQDAKCGALDGLKVLFEEGGEAKLKSHGITDLTIAEIRKTLSDPSPINQARIGARMQAEMNAAASGKTHMTAAYYMDHATGEVRMLGAFRAEAVSGAVTTTAIEGASMPELFKTYHKHINVPHMFDEAAALGQAPRQLMINATTRYNANKYIPAAEMVGQVFTTEVQRDAQGVITKVGIQSAVAGVDYAQAHPWSKVTFIVAETEEVAAKVRMAAMESKGPDYLNKGGVIVEVVVDESGAVRPGLAKITAAPGVVMPEVKAAEFGAAKFVTRTLISSPAELRPNVVTKQVLISVGNESRVLDLTNEEMLVIKNGGTKATELLKNRGLIVPASALDELAGLTSKAVTMIAIPVTAMWAAEEALHYMGLNDNLTVGVEPKPVLASKGERFVELVKETNIMNGYSRITRLIPGEEDFNADEVHRMVMAGMERKNVFFKLTAVSAEQQNRLLMERAVWVSNLTDLNNPSQSDYMNRLKGVATAGVKQEIMVDDVSTFDIPGLPVEARRYSTTMQVRAETNDGLHHESPKEGDALVYEYTDQKKNEDPNNTFYNRTVRLVYRGGKWKLEGEQAELPFQIIYPGNNGEIVEAWFMYRMDPADGAMIYPVAYRITGSK